MGLFSRSFSLKESGLLRGFTDCHSHILPGVDDGVREMSQALAILERYRELGITAVWLTPHIMEDVPNTTQALKLRLSELREAYHGTITLHLASENMMDNLFEQRLADNDLLPWGGTRDTLLVETSYFNPPLGMENILRRVMGKGYYPLLAHPERYLYMDKTQYDLLKRMGVRFQLNIFSLVGLYGKQAKEKALWLLGKGMYDCCGTDIHRYFFVEPPLVEKRIFPYAALKRMEALVGTNRNA